MKPCEPLRERTGRPQAVAVRAQLVCMPRPPPATAPQEYKEIVLRRLVDMLGCLARTHSEDVGASMRASMAVGASASCCCALRAASSTTQSRDR
ncbi:MAG: hypothetical protein ACPIOQ_25945 [Promethearchaeia archaeon]